MKKLKITHTEAIGDIGSSKALEGSPEELAKYQELIKKVASARTETTSIREIANDLERELFSC